MSRASAQPMRSCVACRTTKAKQELVRVVRLPEGRAQLDPRGRAPGRGAYLCRTQACLTLARKRRAVERALHVTIGPDDWAALKAGIL
ncbi:MAG TPA: YlxR family protein [Candidatus Limnocylindrales bacterium]|nr:YlxR family protein [Candidatus Limnocylindrales bacterium]